MKAISLWQPYASAIALGLKRHETRGWSTSHRGPIAIHASKRWSREQRELCRRLAEELGRPELAEPPLGAVVATATIAAVLPSEAAIDLVEPVDRMLGDYAPGRFAWRLKDVRPLPRPMPWSGRQGIFSVPDEALA